MSWLALLGLVATAAPPTALEVTALEAVQTVPSVEVVVARTTPFAGGPRVRLAQQASGLPVHGGDLVVALDFDGEVRRVVGTPLRAVPATTPTLTASDAMDLASHATEGSGSLWPPRAELVILAHDGAGRLAWRVDVSRAAPLGAWHVLVDAHSGTIIRSEPTLFHAQGNIYRFNPTVSILEEVELPGVTDGLLRSTWATVVSCDTWDERAGGCLDMSAHAQPDDNGDFLFAPDALSLDDPFAEVQMYYHLDLVAAWFDTLGFAHAPMSGQRPMVGFVNFPYDNAFYGDADGDGVPEVAFGNGTTADFAYDADVVYHEFAHSVYGEIVRPVYGESDEYGFEGAPVGLNEGTADLFSLALTLDPLLGEYAGVGFGLGGAVRNLEPDLRCPDDIYGESHEDGKIWASLGWNLIDDERVGPDLTAELVMGALALFPSDTNWEEAGQALSDSADDLLDAGAIDATQHAAILEHGERSGVIGCGRVVRLDEGATSTQYLRGRSGRSIAGYTQFSLDAPEGTVELGFRIDAINANDPALETVVFVRRGEHVVHELVEFESPRGTIEMPSATTYDFAVEGLGDGDTLLIDAETELVLEPGATYYFAYASFVAEGNDGFFGGEITVSGSAVIEEVVDTGDPDDEEVRACGCGVAGSATWWGLWVLPVLVVRRRR